MAADNVMPLHSGPGDDATSPPPPNGADAPKKGGRGAKREKKFDGSVYGRLLKNFALVYSTDTAWDGESRRFVKIQALRLAMGNDEVRVWLANKDRHMVLPEEIVFEPGMKPDDHRINLFDGLPMEPKKGDCSPILELLHHLCSESADDAEGVAKTMAWALRWLALPLQRPGTKLRSAMVFHGPQGAGKNLLFEIVAAIYGKYALVVGQDQLEDKFNDWASMKLFLIGDEVVARQELYHQKNKLKAFITGETIQINAKMLPLRTEANHVNVVFLSNDLQPLALEPGDRRYFVVYTPPRRVDDLYSRVAQCLANGGHAAFYRYLLDVDLAGFSEYDIPPMTNAKADLIELGLKPQERFVQEWIGKFLQIPFWPCATEQLYRAFRRWCGVTGERFPPSQTTFSKGVEKAARGKLTLRKVRFDQPWNGKEYMRMWLPEGTGPNEGTSEGAWSRQCVDDFEAALSSFVGDTGAMP